MQPSRPQQLRTAARMADGLVYAAGMAGVVAGGLLFRDGEPTFAVVAWVLTFIAGALLRLAAALARGVADLLDRAERLERDLDLLRSGPGDAGAQGLPRDPYRRWGSGWH